MSETTTNSTTPLAIGELRKVVFKSVENSGEWSSGKNYFNLFTIPETFNCNTFIRVENSQNFAIEIRDGKIKKFSVGNKEAGIVVKITQPAVGTHKGLLYLEISSAPSLEQIVTLHLDILSYNSGLDLSEFATVPTHNPGGGLIGNTTSETSYVYDRDEYEFFTDLKTSATNLDADITNLKVNSSQTIFTEKSFEIIIPDDPVTSDIDETRKLSINKDGVVIDSPTTIHESLYVDGTINGAIAFKDDAISDDNKTTTYVNNLTVKGSLTVIGETKQEINQTVIGNSIFIGKPSGSENTCSKLEVTSSHISFGRYEWGSDNTAGTAKTIFESEDGFFKLGPKLEVYSSTDFSSNSKVFSIGSTDSYLKLNNNTTPSFDVIEIYNDTERKISLNNDGSITATKFIGSLDTTKITTSSGNDISFNDKNLTRVGTIIAGTYNGATIDSTSFNDVTIDSGNVIISPGKTLSVNTINPSSNSQLILNGAIVIKDNSNNITVSATKFTGNIATNSISTSSGNDITFDSKNLKNVGTISSGNITAESIKGTSLSVGSVSPDYNDILTMSDTNGISLKKDTTVIGKFHANGGDGVERLALTSDGLTVKNSKSVDLLSVSDTGVSIVSSNSKSLIDIQDSSSNIKLANDTNSVSISNKGISVDGDNGYISVDGILSTKGLTIFSEKIKTWKQTIDTTSGDLVFTFES